MVPELEIINRLYQEEVERPRQMPGEQKLLAGARLFDLACRVTTDGIRAQHPGIGEEEVLDVVRKRLRLARELEHKT